MVSPVSFGDVFLMAILAKKIALAFTTGHRSAPAEFREVENQLYSLGTALAAFQAAAEKSSSEFSDQTITDMLRNCYSTLKHLEKIVEKYGKIAEQQDPTEGRLQRWSRDLVKNYKKVAWTTESGDLATLRSQLMLHTNSLDLILGIIIKFLTDFPDRDSLKQNSDKLSEIHSWWERNLKAPVIEPVDPIVARSDPLTTFEVHLETGRDAQPICPRSSLRGDWRESARSQLFRCYCRQKSVGGNDSEPAHLAVEKLGLSRISFPFRQLQKGLSWTICQVTNQSNNKLVSIIIRNVPLADFEDSFIYPLAELRGSSMCNVLAHPLTNDRVRILNLRGNLGNIHQFVDTVTFGVQHRSLTKSDIGGLSILHYREIHHNSADDGGRILDYAEVVVHYGEQTADSSRITRSEVWRKSSLHNSLHQGTNRHSQTQHYHQHRRWHQGGDARC
ncbi:hypothetical protein QBC34DRAFT_304236 [Podospora aff. communis PSN243]|uniref:NACHT-NTPase and P-loop NTPases N-terminal domain-containing protein n=1 Tax=Podospora aff. communis PSN243 TaxID=3040156 RepID=A0AAV9GD23_9PEZI|nr:hypothetical protein QBC34DRAFT_304236 [Podospora aff. communis PSN243]